MKIFSPKRPHPIIIFTGVFTSIKEFLIPIILAIGLQARSGSFLFESGFGLYFILGVIVLGGISGFFRWFFFKYSYADRILHIKYGVFVKKERFIKKERVHTINFKAGILWRLLGLVTLQIETPGGNVEPEINIQAVERDKAEKIRNALKQKEQEETSSDEETNNSDVWSVSYKRLVIAGMTSSGVGLIFSFLAVVISQGVAIVPQEFYNLALQLFQNTRLNLLIFLIFFAFFLSWIISILRFVISYGDFKITKNDDEILVSRGLLEKKQLTLKAYRIQAIRIVEGLLRQPLGYALIEVEVAGGANQDDGFKTVIHPMIKKEELKEFIEFIAPERNYSTEHQRLPKRAIKRYIIRATAPLLPLLVLFYFTPYPVVWFGLILFPIAGYIGYHRYKDGSYIITNQDLIMRYRNIARTTVLMKKSQIQSMQLQTNFIQKARNLTTLKASVLTAMLSVTFTVKDISKESGKELWQWFSRDN